jgi:hypothetical protein
VPLGAQQRHRALKLQSPSLQQFLAFCWIVDYVIAHDDYTKFNTLLPNEATCHVPMVHSSTAAFVFGWIDEQITHAGLRCGRKGLAPSDCALLTGTSAARAGLFVWRPGPGARASTGGPTDSR